MLGNVTGQRCRNKVAVLPVAFICIDKSVGRAQMYLRLTLYNYDNYIEGLISSCITRKKKKWKYKVQAIMELTNCSLHNSIVNIKSSRKLYSRDDKNQNF